MAQDVPLELNTYSGGEQIAYYLYNLRVHHLVHKSASVEPVGKPGLGVKSRGNAILLNPSDSRTTVLRYNNNNNNNDNNNNNKNKNKSRWRLCKKYEETIDRLTSGCPILANNEYVIRHDRVCTHLHYSICKTLGIETSENWYSHIPNSACQHEDIAVLWNQGVQTDREVLANRPDIIIKT
jgi:hypothetical protein